MSFFLLAACADPVQDRTSPPTVQDDKHSTGWCYTMLRPVRSPPVSSDPAGYAKTKERDRKRKRKRKRKESGKFMGE